MQSIEVQAKKARDEGWGAVLVTQTTPTCTQILSDVPRAALVEIAELLLTLSIEEHEQESFNAPKGVEQDVKYALTVLRNACDKIHKARVALLDKEERGEGEEED